MFKNLNTYDIMVKEEDAPRINRLVERFKLATVSEAAQIKTEIEKSREEKGKAVPEKQTPGKSQEDILVDELLGESLKKEKGKPNPALEKTGSSRLLENTSKKRSKNEEGISKTKRTTIPKKASVRKELQEIKASRQEDKTKNTRSDKTIQHKQPKKRNKKPKAR